MQGRSGQGLIEFGVIMVLISVVAVAAVEAHRREEERQRLGLPAPDTRLVKNLDGDELRAIIREEVEAAIRKSRMEEK